MRNIQNGDGPSGVSVRKFWRFVAILLLTTAFCSAVVVFAMQDYPRYEGRWVEMNPKSGPPMSLLLRQEGNQVQVQISYTGRFVGAIDGVANIENGVASWSVPQGCAPRFQTPGYNYSSPGFNVFRMAIRREYGDGEPREILYYRQETRWNAPCGGHPIGTEHSERVLTRVRHRDDF